ncbi:polysaccharide pyruvyl transferase family protein [Lutibacter sp. A80]|uniref:polysaccharide pyruvyl transferase family protein n=1 Tax=Lutibacter sp. A80 TaxID=2918453 RepID=UPI001F0521E1|nr:polysaccharide pyruvyl transferase family protein [Lutibacter sp. A80]UMB61658.1 polysaccharide pyruvyl transferase family protein [Lutibacter sp. A80]
MVKHKKTDSIKLLINNVVPLNNGDVALFYALYKKLENAGFQVKIATYYYKQAKELYPNLPFVEEIGQHKIFMKLPFLKPLLLPLLFLFSKHYREADVLVGTPGGYINSNYNIKNSLSIYKIAKYFGKKSLIYSQSVGPLNQKDALFFQKLMDTSISYIFVRDQFSFNILTNLNISKQKFKLTKDAAFLLDFKEQASVNLKKVGVSVREWNYDGRNRSDYIKMISTFIKECIDRGYTIEFISTCQGLANYKDDAKLAQEIYDNLDITLQDKTTVLADYFKFEDFYKKIEEYDFVIGTRLHMCITSLTKNIPAFNISYEVKGKECYNYLELSEYSIDYNEGSEKAMQSFTNFITNTDGIRAHLKNIMPKINKESNADFNFFKQKITEF